MAVSKKGNGTVILFLSLSLSHMGVLLLSIGSLKHLEGFPFGYVLHFLAAINLL